MTASHRGRGSSQRLNGFGVLVLLSAMSVTACSDELVQDCSIPGQNRAVYSLMKDIYLWADEVPEVDPESFESPEALLNAVAYRKLDRWSGIGSAKAREELFDRGRFLGVGLRFVTDNEGATRVAFVEPKSPAAAAGMTRGLRILAINGKSLEEISEQGLWGSISGPNEPGVEVTYDTEQLDGTSSSFVVEKNWFELDTVLSRDVLTVGERKVGYLLFTGFLLPTEDDLRQNFGELKAAGVEDLILDLRYNGGGLVRTATVAASLMVGAERAGEVFTQVRYNDRHPERNEDILFVEEPNAVALKRLVALVGPGTASASELILNGLRPYVDVELVGAPTEGKPVGSSGYRYCEKVIAPISFFVRNARGEGDYFMGMKPGCVAADDLSHKLGDPNEARLSRALEVLAGAPCEISTEFKSFTFRMLSGGQPIPGDPALELDVF